MQISSTILKSSSSALLLLVFSVSRSTSAQVGIETTDPKSTLEVNGSFAQKVNTVTADTTLTIDNGIVICNNGATAITLTLPTAVGISGRIYTIKRNAASTANVTIAGTINGSTNLILTAAGQAETLFSDGTEWKSLSKYEAGWSTTGNAGTSAGTNFIGTTDAQDLVLKTNNVSRVNISSDGVTTIGGATNRTKFEADGTIVLEGSATVWDDIMVYPDATTKGANNSPAWTSFKKDAAGNSRGVFLWEFSPSTEQEIYFSVQLPHSYTIGTPLQPHVHWTTFTGTPNNTNGRVVWTLEYTVMSIGGTFPTTSTTTGNQVIAGVTTITGTGQHLITSLGQIPSTGLGISTILVCRLYRAATATEDDFGNSAGFLGFDIHFEKNTDGSRTPFVK